MEGISATQYASRLKTLTKPRLQDLMHSSIKKKEIELWELKANEFLRGETPTGETIGRYFDPEYALFKQRQNPLAGGKVDLFLTGAFMESAHLLQLKTGVYTFAFSDSKAPKLIRKYGKKIKGINQDTFNHFIEKFVKDNFVKSMKQFARI